MSNSHRTEPGRLRAAIIDHPHSLAEAKRARRWDQLAATFPDIADMRVLDLGGTLEAWERSLVGPDRVVCVNPFQPACRRGPFELVNGDACTWSGGGFDLVYSNSTIEHVGGHHRRQCFAAAVLGSAPRHWVQTPYRYFPIEPHVVAPLVQHLPLAVRAWVCEWWPLQHARPGCRSAAAAEQMGTELLDITMMRAYFPGSEIRFERVCGLVKSLVAVQTGR